MGLLDEAVERAYADRRRERRRQCPTRPTPSAEQVAERVGIGAIKYADLSHNRTSDYVFSYDKMLAMNGNTATYMQYSYARVRSIFGKGDVDVEALRASDARIVFSEPDRAGARPGDPPLLRGAGPVVATTIGPTT